MASSATFTDFVHGFHPLNAINVSSHAVYTTSQVLMAEDDNGGWEELLGEIEALRVAESSTRHYYGVVRTSYSSGVAGIGYVGGNTAVGWDYTSGAGQIAAHELGHTTGGASTRPAVGRPTQTRRIRTRVGALASTGSTLSRTTLSRCNCGPT